ncbi:2408_t:CDS:2 [Ambispora leptoticha]|uniref:2408_t:CDS:1 n=1 Tax=Ambispora leptoticha TaxID=144679 RepID=A0A9N8ZXX2_9GLOM|nr:2408_t:CDS:2 [Ambispora leptoticha]
MQPMTRTSKGKTMENIPIVNLPASSPTPSPPPIDSSSTKVITQTRRSKRRLNSEISAQDDTKTSGSSTSKGISPQPTVSSYTNVKTYKRQKITSTTETNDAYAKTKATYAATELASLVPQHHEEKIFKNFRLRRIVKENHGHDINQLAFFFNLNNYGTPIGSEYRKDYNKHGHVVRDVGDTSNILSSVGDVQANIYDNEHCGDHLDIMSNFSLEDESGKNFNVSELLTCCWLHRPNDALLAVAGRSKIIYIISLATSSTLRELSGHKDVITDIAKHPKDDLHLLSASNDNTVRLWNTDTSQCLYIFETSASAICWNPSGEIFLTGSYKGHILQWLVPDQSLDSENPRRFKEKDLVINMNELHMDAIDCIRFVNGNVLTKSIDGKLEHWNPETMYIYKSYNIKNGSNNRSRFDVSLDGCFFCVGTNIGSVCVYNLTTGKLVTELRHRRSIKAVRCCAFTKDYKQIVAGGEESFIWRYDYVSNETLEEWEKWTASD